MEYADDMVVWRSDDHLQELLLSYHHVGPGDWTQAGWQEPLHNEQAHKPKLLTLNKFQIFLFKEVLKNTKVKS